MSKIYGKKAGKKGKKALIKAVENNQSAVPEEEEACKLKGALACPQHLLTILTRQTDLTESQIHVKYMKFRSLYPTGFVGPHVLRNLCLDVLNEKECDEYVNTVFTLYGQRKKGWGAKFIGFREVVLATESIHKLNYPDEVLKWIFRVYDSEASGEIPITKIPEIIGSLLSLCVRLSGEDDVETITEAILDEFDMKPYDDNMISEEEFIYDSLNNKKLHQLLNSSLKTYAVDIDLDEGSETSDNSEMTDILETSDVAQM